MRHSPVLTVILASALVAAGAHAQSAPPPNSAPMAQPPPYGAPPPNVQALPWGAPPANSAPPPPYGAAPPYPAPAPYAGGQPYPPPPYGSAPPYPPPGQAAAPSCREFTATVMIAGQPQPAYGQACQRPDGSWQVTENAPGQPPQVYVLPPSAIYANPYPAPYYWAGDVAVGLPFLVAGSIVFADAFHHFHGPAGHHRGPPPGRFHDGFRGERR